MEYPDKNYKLEKFSPSMIISYLDCPLRFYYEYIAKIKLPKSPALAIGSGVHKGIETFYLGKGDPEKEMIDCYLKQADPESSKKDLDEGKEMCKILLENFYEASDFMEINYKISTGKSENYIKKVLTHPLTGEPMDIPMSGIIDRLGNDRIFEFKTASKKWNQDDVNFRSQTLLYNLWYFNTYGKIPDETVYLILLKKKKVKKTDVTYQILTTKPDILDLASTFEEVQITLDKISNGMFNRPTGYHPPYCDCYKYEKLLNTNL